MSKTEHEYPRASGYSNRFVAQAFIASATGPTFDTFANLRTSLWRWQGPSCCGNRLHRINSQQYGLMRQVIGPSGTSLTRDQITNAFNTQTPPAGAALDNVGQMPLKINVSADNGVSYSFFADANQPIEVYASCPSVELLGPATLGGLVNPGAPVTLTTVDGFFYDSLTDVDLSCVDASLTQELVKLTQRVGIANGATGTIVVPPRAKRFTIYTTSTTAAWTMFVGLAGVTFSEQIVTFNASGIATGEVGDSTTLVSDVVAADRLFTIVWEIQP